jgi:mannan endo-1,4-beta-mannosidase
VTAGSSALSSWKVTWTYANGQTITSGWNANVTQSGSSVTATNASYNGSISAGASTSFGFQGTWSGTNAVPTLTCT